jgi:hypothetical protein
LTASPSGSPCSIFTSGGGGGSTRVDEGGLFASAPSAVHTWSGVLAPARTRPSPTRIVLGESRRQFLGSSEIDRAIGLAVDRSSALGLDRVAAAEGILRVANANTGRAIRRLDRAQARSGVALAAFGAVADSMPASCRGPGDEDGDRPVPASVGTRHANGRSGTRLRRRGSRAPGLEQRFRSWNGRRAGNRRKHSWSGRPASLPGRRL